MDEKKTYDFKGTVTISTEEYRDLIEKCAELKADYSKRNSDYYEEYRKRQDLEKQLKEMQEELINLRRYVNAKEETRLAFKLFLVEEKEAAKC